VVISPRRQKTAQLNQAPSTEALDIEKVQDMEDNTEPDGSTRETERSEAGKSHTADRPPTSEEDAAAERERAESDPDDRKDVAEHHEEMTELGAQVKGEGEIK
jgi:hypothetical protein